MNILDGNASGQLPSTTHSGTTLPTLTTTAIPTQTITITCAIPNFCSKKC
jgi:hypothetical protein